MLTGKDNKHKNSRAATERSYVKEEWLAERLFLGKP